MRGLVFAAAISLPIADIASLIAVGQRLGVWPTIAMVLIAAFAGSILLRTQGFSLLLQAQQTLAEGRFPAREAFDGACVLIGGALLIFPGFVSDLFGLLLLTPLVRAGLRKAIGAALLRSGVIEITSIDGVTTKAGADGSRRESGPIIDGEYQFVDTQHPTEDAAAKEPRREDRAISPHRSPWQSPHSGPVVPSDDP